MCSRSMLVGRNVPIIENEQEVREAYEARRAPIEIRKRDALAKRYINEAAAYRRLHSDQRRHVSITREDVAKRYFRHQGIAILYYIEFLLTKCKRILTLYVLKGTRCE